MHRRLPAENVPLNELSERDAAIEQWTPLVKHVVGRLSRHLPAVLDYEDLLSYGTIGLMQAFDRYDDSKGVQFQTYAMTRIRGAIIDAFRSLDPFPRSIRQKAKKLATVTDELTSMKGREPTNAEVAQGMGMSMKEYNQARTDCSWVTVSLDGLLERDETSASGSAKELPADPSQEDFTNRVARLQLLDALGRAIECLPEREKLIVSLYYQDEMRMREIAQILDVSESRVCQLHAQALSRLRLRLARDRAA